MSAITVTPAAAPVVPHRALSLVATLMALADRAGEALRAPFLPREPRTTEELLALADAYARTQPSYAADLRAAALAADRRV